MASCQFLFRLHQIPLPFLACRQHTCIPALFAFSLHSIIYLLQLCYDGLLVTGRHVYVCYGSRMPDGLREEQMEGLSGKAGPPPIAMPIKTAALSTALGSQIRPPDGAALQWDPHRWHRPKAKIYHFTVLPAHCLLSDYLWTTFKSKIRECSLIVKCLQWPTTSITKCVYTYEEFDLVLWSITATRTK